MKTLSFSAENSEQHTCTGHREGDWIYFTCPLCPYQRAINWKTGEMTTNAKDNPILHTGFHMPVEITTLEEN